MVAQVAVLRRLLYDELDAGRAVEGVRDVEHGGVHGPAQAFLHCDVGGLQRDEARHHAHRHLQVLHRSEAVADVQREGVVTLAGDTGSQRVWKLSSNVLLSHFINIRKEK